MKQMTEYKQFDQLPNDFKNDYDAFYYHLGASGILEKYYNVIQYFFQWPTNSSEAYLQNGLQGEVGELASAYAKFYRGDYDEDELLVRVKNELGDILFFVIALAKWEGLDPADLLEHNIDKLTDRMIRNKIKGDGDTR